MIKLTPGKLAGLKAVSNERGVIAAAAMDQRGSLQKSLAKEAGSSTVPASALEEFKTLVTSVLTKHASAILLDPEFGLPASKHRNGKGLLLAYEKTGYDTTEEGRLPDLLDHWSVRRLKEAGADCVKILLYYSPMETSAINDVKHAFIERVGDECRAHDIAFFLEFVGYDHKGGDEKSLAYAKAKPAIVSGSMAEFGKEKYGVDVLKVEVPVQMEFVGGAKAFKGEEAYTRAEALQHFRDAAGATPQAVHLSQRRRVKPRLHRDAGVSRRIRHHVQRRPLRPRYLEGRHEDLRRTRRQSLRRVAQHHRRRKHQQREQGAREGPQLARQGRPEASRKARARPGVVLAVRAHALRANKRAPRQRRSLVLYFKLMWRAAKKSKSLESIYLRDISKRMRPPLLALRRLSKGYLDGQSSDPDVTYRARVQFLAAQYGLEALEATQGGLGLTASFAALSFLECALLNICLSEEIAVRKTKAFNGFLGNKPTQRRYQDALASLHFSTLIKIALELQWFELETKHPRAASLLPDEVLKRLAKELSLKGNNIPALRGFLIVTLTKHQRNNIHPGRLAASSIAFEDDNYAGRLLIFSFETFLLLKAKIDDINATLA